MLMINRYIVGNTISQGSRRGILQSKPPKDTQYTQKCNISTKAGNKEYLAFLIMYDGVETLFFGSSTVVSYKPLLFLLVFCM